MDTYMNVMDDIISTLRILLGLSLGVFAIMYWKGRFDK